MSNLIDRDELLVVPYVRKVVEYDELGEFITFHAVSEEDIKNASAVDAVEVVRCGECIHSRPPLFPHPTKLFCTIIEHSRGPDWFCADGKKEEKG